MKKVHTHTHRTWINPRCVAKFAEFRPPNRNVYSECDPLNSCANLLFNTTKREKLYSLCVTLIFTSKKMLKIRPDWYTKILLMNLFKTQTYLLLLSENQLKSWILRSYRNLLTKCEFPNFPSTNSVIRWEECFHEVCQILTKFYSSSCYWIYMYIYTRSKSRKCLQSYAKLLAQVRCVGAIEIVIRFTMAIG